MCDIWEEFKALGELGRADADEICPCVSVCVRTRAWNPFDGFLVVITCRGCPGRQVQCMPDGMCTLEVSPLPNG